MMKQVNIDLGKMNLIYKPKEKNLEVAINALVHNGAIDENWAWMYISLIIENAKLLIKDEKPDKLLQFFDDDSDIVTLFNALNSLLKEYKFDKKQKSKSRINNINKNNASSKGNSIDYINQTPSLSTSIDYANQVSSKSTSIDIDYNKSSIK